MLYILDFIRENSLRFNESITYGEDVEFNLRAMILAKRVMAIS